MCERLSGQKLAGNRQSSKEALRLLVSHFFFLTNTFPKAYLDSIFNYLAVNYLFT